MRRIALPSAALALALLVAGCASLEDELLGRGGDDDDRYRDRDRRTVEYRCDEDRRIEVRYRDDGDEAEVRAGGREYRLGLEDRDGRRRTYGEDDVVLTVDGDEARLRVRDGSDYQGCEEDD